MNQPNQPIDEARLTAFALGELSPEEHAALERVIAGNPAAQASVKRIRDLSVQLKGVLLNEPLPVVRPLDFSTVKTLKPSIAQAPGKVVRFPYYWVGGLAAACVAAAFVLHQRQPSIGEPHEPRTALVTPPAVSTETKSPARRDAEPATVLAENKFLPARQNPLSTFAADVDTASYETIRRFLESGQRPPQDAVRIEELVNYFNYRYATPAQGETPFATTMEVASAPWNPAHRLVRIGIQGREITDEQRPPANLVFLVDASASMSAPHKLPLLKESMRLLVEKLKPSDRVSIITYAGATGLALPSTPVALKRDVLAAVEKLAPADAVQGAHGIQLAYDIARANFVSEGINRVILCTDGVDFGATHAGDLTGLVETKARAGVYLSVLGFGLSEQNDAHLKRLADLGQGNYGHADTLAESKRLLFAQATSSLTTIAKDVKLQVEFNPLQVAAYRLLGYENRKAHATDTASGATDTLEIGAGHTVTALYEVIPVGQAVPPEALAQGGDPLRYEIPEQDVTMLANRANRQPIDVEMLTLKIRYTPPQVAISRKVEVPVIDGGKLFADASLDFQFAASVAGFGMILSESPHKGDANFDNVMTWAGKAASDPAQPERKDFIELVKKAKTLNAE